MRAVLLMFCNLCLLRRGPEVVPTHPWFVVAIALCYVLVELYLAIHVGRNVPMIAMFTYLFVSMAATASLTWFALYLRQLESRFPATITALFGSSLLLSALLAVMMQFTGAIDSLATRSLAIVIGMWTMIVWGFMLHRSMNVSWPTGMVLSVGTILLSVALGNVASTP
jgi:hypothetical protein